MTQDPRAHWRRLIGASLLVLAAAFLLPLVVKAPDLQENRPLAPPPPPVHGLGDLTPFRKAADAYVADHFPPRSLLIGGLNRLRMLVGVSGSSRVIVGRDGWLFSDDGSHLGAARGVPRMDPEQTAAWLKGLAGRTEYLRARGAAYVVLCPPDKETIYPQLAPDWMALEPNRPAILLPRLADAAEVGTVVYPRDAILRQARWGLQTYSAHDTHWTGLGAYFGYVELMRALNRQGLAEPSRPLEDFKEVRKYDANKPRNLTLMLGVSSFVTVNYPELEDPNAPVLQVTFLSDNHDWTGPRVIDTGQVGKPVLLITADSFSNALMPFLYSHFSRIVTAHLQDGAWRPDLIDRFHPDFVVSEVVETGLPVQMRQSPEPTPEALARIRRAVTDRARYEASPDAGQVSGVRKRIEGGAGDDHLVGRGRPEDIQGGPGNDTIEGRGGDDVIRGGRGRDVVEGGDGDDWLSGGRGDDILRGGRGADIFNTFAGSGTDEVLDFSPEEFDRVEVDPGVAYTVRQVGADTVVEMTDGRLILRNVRLADLRGVWIRNR